MKSRPAGIIEILDFQGRSLLNLILLFLYQILVVWPVVAALVIIYLFEPGLSLADIVADVYSQLGIFLINYISNILHALTVSGFFIISLLYVITVPIVEIREFPKKSAAAFLLFAAYIVNMLIIFYGGGVESVKDGIIAYGIINFMSFFLLFVMVYFRSLPNLYKMIIIKLKGGVRNRTIEVIIFLSILSLILLAGLVLSSIIGFYIYYDASGYLIGGGDMLYYFGAVIVLAVLGYRNIKIGLFNV